MIEVTEEFIEAVHGRQKLVFITKVVFAKLAGSITYGFQRGGDCHGLWGDSDGSAGLTYRGHASPDRQFAGNKVGAPRCAARLGVIISEYHALSGHLVEVRRAPGHHAAMIGADVPHTNVVAHDDNDVRLA